VVWAFQAHIGPLTICIFILLLIPAGPFSLLVFCMPCDTRRVTHIVR
jgi:hypothetical protein